MKKLSEGVGVVDPWLPVQRRGFLQCFPKILMLVEFVKSHNAFEMLRTSEVMAGTTVLVDGSYKKGTWGVGAVMEHPSEALIFFSLDCLHGSRCLLL